MTTFELYEIAPSKSRPGTIVAGVARLATGWARWRARRRTILRLAHLDAVQLADIGLERIDVEDALDGDERRLWAKVSQRNAD